MPIDKTMPWLNELIFSRENTTDAFKICRHRFVGRWIILIFMDAL